MKVSNQDCAKLGKTQATSNKANPGHVTLIQIEKCPERVSIPDCSSISSLEEGYGSAEDMSTSPDTSSADVNKSFDLENNFREKLNNFENIIEKIQNLHFGSNENKNDDNKKNVNENVDRTCRVSKENNVNNEEYWDTCNSRASSHSDNEDENNNEDDNVTVDDNEYCLPLNFRDEEPRLSLDDRNPNKDDDSEAEQERRQKHDSDLTARGPIKPDFQTLRAGHPYSMVSSLSRVNDSVDVIAQVDYDKTAEQILRNKDYSEKLNPCLDKLSNYRNNQSSIGEIISLTLDSGWTGENGGDIVHSGHPSDDIASSTYRALPSSSSSSSNQSYSDVSSPLNYQTPLNRQLQEQLDETLSGWGTYDSSETIVNSSDTIDSSLLRELQFVEQVIEEVKQRKEPLKELQVASNAPCFSSNYNDRCVPPIRGTLENNLEFECPVTSDARKSEKPICLDVLNSQANPIGNLMSIYTNRQNTSGGTLVNCTVNGQAATGLEQRYFETSVKNSQVDVSTYTLHNIALTDNERPVKMPETNGVSRENYAMPRAISNGEKRYNQASSTFVSNDYQIPTMVFPSFTSSPQRNSNRGILPWPSLNLPSVEASERLKEGLDSKEVERAMSNLLKKSVEELAAADEDGDTPLMCLVGNPEELTEKKAYLAPLVERLDNIPGALSAMNNRGEDALYLAVMNCPEMPYVSGYLAAKMLQKGIDINQRLCHIHGDTLIHNVVARGDSHGEVLAELLSLKTPEGNSVFNLSHCNYDGKTALHIAVESHDPIGRGVKSLITTRLLLENGADLKAKDNKCGDTALHMAASLSCDPALVKVLLCKATLRIVNESNYICNTPLHMAAAVSNAVPLEKQKEVCRLLIQAGGQTNIQNRQGKTPLALVSSERKEAIKKIFYKKL
ncbi:NF-kappa-B inhibitor zeta [Camponotus floridanus]|uniref:NF-kappa-B inhibitor zeta n=1 Tax=Camponotus floridanus TaxID=104421 RepID=E2ANH9_CAMFO|nr:NF-kappa-B inhibitor zeta [Camponotus floridanus]